MQRWTEQISGQLLKIADENSIALENARNYLDVRKPIDSVEFISIGRVQVKLAELASALELEIRAEETRIEELRDQEARIEEIRAQRARERVTRSRKPSPTSASPETALLEKLAEPAKPDRRSMNSTQRRDFAELLVAPCHSRDEFAAKVDQWFKEAADGDAPVR